MLFEKLSKLVESSDLTQSEFEALNCGLSPQQMRLFLYLSEVGTANTIDVRKNCSIGNISDVTNQLNKNLAANGLNKMVACVLKPHVNQFGKTGVLGHWMIVDSTAANDSK
jgi:hypothetical protein